MSKAYTSSVIPAPVQKVWDKIRDYNGLAGWHPLVADSHIEDGLPADSVGCIRNFNLIDGDNIRERLLALSDTDYLCTYSILDSPMPLKNYVATVRLRPITDGDRTYGEWTASFDCSPQDEAALVDLISNGVFQTGFNALKTQFGG